MSRRPHHDLKHLVFIGMPGSGKSTQAARVAAHLGIPHIVAGDLVRQAAMEHTPLGETVNRHVQHGDLVPDDVVTAVILPRLTSDAVTDGYVLDGFPRNLAQALALEHASQMAGSTVDAAVYLDVDVDEVRRRLAQRSVGQCRDDDGPSVVEHRLSVFEDQTRPLRKYYSLRRRLVTVPAGGPADEVFLHILDGLDQLVIERAQVAT
ncbi:MAG TPA: nucleoside monophosphate kinase [Acidimicrobiales bacterium]|nr:nucleoside monophosphate kinase [Acidimicrobiales bacterium]